jgi:hypothetical protein
MCAGIPVNFSNITIQWADLPRPIQKRRCCHSEIALASSVLPLRNLFSFGPLRKLYTCVLKIAPYKVRHFQFFRHSIVTFVIYEPTLNLGNWPYSTT